MVVKGDTEMMTTASERPYHFGKSCLFVTAEKLTLIPYSSGSHMCAVPWMVRCHLTNAWSVSSLN
jgi:hypothetical protein